MQIPKKCGDMYISFDEENRPKYGFLVDGNKIQKFVNLTDKMPKVIVLPVLVKNDIWKWPGEVDQKTIQLVGEYFINKTKLDYLEGQIDIADKCFKGVKNAVIVKTSEESVAFSHSAFDKDAKIKFMMPKNMTLKEVHARESGLMYDERGSWLVLADKKAEGSVDLKHAWASAVDYKTKHNDSDPELSVVCDKPKVKIEQPSLNK